MGFRLDRAKQRGEDWLLSGFHGRKGAAEQRCVEGVVGRVIKEDPLTERLKLESNQCEADTFLSDTRILAKT